MYIHNCFVLQAYAYIVSSDGWEFREIWIVLFYVSNLCICLSLFDTVRILYYLSIYSCFYVFIHFFIHSFIDLLICLLVYLFMYLLLYLYIHVIYIFIYVSICVYIYVYVFIYLNCTKLCSVLIYLWCSFYIIQYFIGL